MSDYRPSILAPAPRCPDCETVMEAGVCYDGRMRERVDCWRCPGCETKTYRDETDDGVQLRDLARLVGNR